MKFTTIACISLALACIKRMPLASPVPCQGCVPSSAEPVSPRSANIDVEPIPVSTSSKSPYPACVPNAPIKAAARVTRLIEAAEATSTPSDCPGCVQSGGLEMVEMYTEVLLPTPACPGRVPTSAASGNDAT